MTFLILLVIGVMVRLTPWRAGLPVDLPLLWSNALQRRAGGIPLWLLPLVLLVPLLPLGWLLWAVDARGHAAISFLLQLLIMLVAMGRSDPLGRFGAHFEQAWQRGDLAAAALVAEREFDVPAEDASALLDGVRGRLAWETLQSYFVPVFWFVLLGPLAALAYRLWWVAVQQSSAGQPTASLLHALEWVPLRLMGLSMALVGQFDPTLQRLKGLCAKWDVASQEAIQHCLSAALGAAPSQTALAPARTLLERAVLVWALIIAFVELAS